MTVTQKMLFEKHQQGQRKLLPVVVLVAAAVGIPILGVYDEVWEYDLVLEKESYDAMQTVEWGDNEYDPLESQEPLLEMSQDRKSWSFVLEKLESDCQVES